MTSKTITLALDENAAIALATIIRRLTPEDYGDALTASGVDVEAWYRAVDALSPLLPKPNLAATTPSPMIASPGEP
jgi:hypothetical protein